MQRHHLGRLQRQLQDVGHVGDRVHPQLFEDRGRDVVQVRLVALREDDVRDARPVGLGSRNVEYLHTYSYSAATGPRFAQR